MHPGEDVPALTPQCSRRSRLIPYLAPRLAVQRKASTAAGAHPTQFYTFCKVGTGYSIAELEEINSRLRGKWLPWVRGRAPPWMIGYPKDSPLACIHPRDSVILSLKHFQLSECDVNNYSAGITARFPRVQAIRYVPLTTPPLPNLHTSIDCNDRQSVCACHIPPSPLYF